MTSVAEQEPLVSSRSVADPVPASPPERLLSLDVLRGATIAGMLLVNDPGTWSAIYPPLAHAAWHGWTATDLVFPFFLFIVGVTTRLSLDARRARGDSDSDLLKQVFRRGFIIIGLGLFLNAFPFFMWGTIEGNASPTFLDRVLYRFEYLRYLGVLQRIGICYILAALLTFRTTLKQQVLITAALLLGYWFAMTLLPVPGTNQLGGAFLDSKEHNLAAWTDRLILGEKHLWRSAKTFDPEGPLSTIPAIATTILGSFAGMWIQKRHSLVERIAGLLVMGALGMMLGLMWNWVFPINKSLWTSSYVLFTAGMAAVALATCMWIIDFKGIRWWTKPFVVFGVNPILAYVGAGLMARLIYSLIRVPLNGESVPLQAAIYRIMYAPFFAPRNASLLFAISFVLVWYGILLVFYRRRWILKV